MLITQLKPLRFSSERHSFNVKTAADVYDLVLSTHAQRFQTTPEVIETALDAFHGEDEGLLSELRSSYPNGFTLGQAIEHFREHS